MIPKLLSATWPTIALAIGNHLWQSTLFACAAGLLTLVLRNNYARTRYWLWLTTSVKFLIPFSTLVAVGSHLAWPHGSAPRKVGLYFAVQQLSQPFTARITPPITALPPPSPASASPIHFWPFFVATVWLAGFLVVLFVWCSRWRRISASIRDAVPVREGREVEALHRLKGVTGMRKNIQMLLSRTSLEPGIFGLARPVLVWPHGLSERLEDPDLHAIVAHELCHARNRDNLAAAIHMVVEAIFWFYPLVWWLGARLLEERERACDEAVIAAGVDREAYARGLLAVCKFYVESPLACIAGVSGADLKKRIDFIVSSRMALRLNGARKAILSTAAALSILAPIVIGSVFATPHATAQTQAPPSASFQTVSIEQSQPGRPGFLINVGPDSFGVQNYTLRKLIAFAFDSEEALISGSDTLDAKYDVQAKAPAPFPARDGNQTVDAARAMVRQLLTTQFQLQIHRETQSISAYVLTATGATTSLIKVASPADLGPLIHFGPTSIKGTNLRMGEFAGLLSQRIARPVIDNTGLAQTYNFDLDWKTDSSPALGPKNPVPAPLPDVDPGVLAGALEMQLGLTLRLAQNPIEGMIVDSVHPPTNVAPPRTGIAMDTALFDSYAGHYAFPGNQVMTVYREKMRFFTQLSGQPPVEIFPEAQQKFFAKVVDAQISFTLDAQGRTTGLVLHQNGNEIPAPRIDDAAANRIADRVKARVQGQTAAPGSEEALRKLIAGLASGMPDYEQMTPELATITRPKVRALQNMLQSAGALISLKFKGVGPLGGDIYEAEFEHGSEEWRITLAPDGKIAVALVRPAR